MFGWGAFKARVLQMTSRGQIEGHLAIYFDFFDVMDLAPDDHLGRDHLGQSRHITTLYLGL